MEEDARAPRIQMDEPSSKLHTSIYSEYIYIYIYIHIVLYIYIYIYMSDFINLTTSNRKVFYFITRLLRLYYAILRQPSISACCRFGIQLCIKHAGGKILLRFYYANEEFGADDFPRFRGRQLLLRIHYAYITLYYANEEFSKKHGWL